MFRPPPNIAGFKDAMGRLRQQSGGPVTFRVPQTPVWPLGTQINPLTQRPYDPGIQPTSGGGYDEVTKTCGVIFKDASKLRPGSDARFEPGGEFSGMDCIVDLDFADYPAVENATHARIFRDEFKIVEWKPGGLTSQDRYLVYMEET